MKYKRGKPHTQQGDTHNGIDIRFSSRVSGYSNIRSTHSASCHQHDSKENCTASNSGAYSHQIDQGHKRTCRHSNSVGDVAKERHCQVVP